MKLDQPTTLRVEDYADQAKWIGRLFNVLNPLFNTLSQIFDGNIDFTTNIRSLTKDFDTTQLSFPITLSWPFTQDQPADLWVTKALKGSAAIALIPAWSFNASTQEITISEMAEVASGAVAATSSGPRYRFTIRASV